MSEEFKRIMADCAEMKKRCDIMKRDNAIMKEGIAIMKKDLQYKRNERRSFKTVLRLANPSSPISDSMFCLLE